MKKVTIIYILILVLTVVIPAIICFGQKDTSSSKELVNIFNTYISTFYSI
ncbi:MAG: hypothetical protein PUE60_03340 [Eubacteriales bacterium]|nr:hypothetical protein [Eubacteriales bacterium]